MKISKRLIIFVGLLCVITLAIPSHVFCQAEGAAGAGTALQAQAPLVQALKQVEQQQLALVGEQSHLASDWSQQSQQLE